MRNEPRPLKRARPVISALSLRKRVEIFFFKGFVVEVVEF
jgi:hypothetical protein